MRLGIFGGAFNPPHVGHLICAQEALEQAELDRVLFMPTARPPHRVIEDDPGVETRLELTELAIEGNELFEVSRLELEREGPSYTVETLRELRESRTGDDLFLLLGGDQAAALSRWREPETVLDLATVCVFERAGFSRDGIGITLGRLPGAGRIRYLDLPTIQVSSTQVRRRVAKALPIRYLTPDRVIERVSELNLYAPGDRVPAS